MPGEPKSIGWEAGAVSVTAHSWGDPDAPLALLLHGFPDTAWTWRHLGPFLAERGFHAVAPFLRGYAPTSLASDGCYQVGALARDAIAARNMLGGDQAAVLVGHDWGAEAAYAADSFAPGAFDRVVTLSVPPGPVFKKLPRHPRLAARQLRMFWYMAFLQLPWSERTLGALIPRLWRTWSPGYDSSDDARRLLEALPTPAHRTAALRYYRASFGQPQARSREYAAEQRAASSVGPARTLYLHGAEDGCIASEVADLARPYVQTEVVPGVGHFLHLEDPERINQRIGEALESKVDRVS